MQLLVSQVFLYNLDISLRVVLVMTFVSMVGLVWLISHLFYRVFSGFNSDADVIINLYIN
jgi:hypothetical protein